MKSERSLYSKAQLVLKAAGVGRSMNIAELRLQIITEGHPAFLTLQYDESRDDYVLAQSHGAVSRAVNLCKGLGLVTDEGRLSASGRRAVRSEVGFQREVRAAIVERLTLAGASTGQLRTASRQLLTSAQPILPTARHLFESVTPDLSRAEFGRLLTMLADVDGARTEQRRVYLEFS